MGNSREVAAGGLDRRSAASDDGFAEFICAQGHRFRAAMRTRSVVWRLIHLPSWRSGVHAIAFTFGAPAAGLCAASRTR